MYYSELNIRLTVVTDSVSLIQQPVHKGHGVDGNGLSFRLKIKIMG